MKAKKINNKQSDSVTDETESSLDNPGRREALEKLVKYTPPAMITLLAKDSAWAQISGGPPPPPSDFRLKTDIDYVSETHEGHRLYSFRYKNDNARIRYVGVMAQEVMNLNPEAVMIRPDGYYAVYYDRLGLSMTTFEQWQRQGHEAVRCEANQPCLVD